MFALESCFCLRLYLFEAVFVVRVLTQPVQLTPSFHIYESSLWVHFHFFNTNWMIGKSHNEVSLGSVPQMFTSYFLAAGIFLIRSKTLIKSAKVSVAVLKSPVLNSRWPSPSALVTMQRTREGNKTLLFFFFSERESNK